MQVHEEKNKNIVGIKQHGSYEVKSYLLELTVCGHFFVLFSGVWFLWGDGDEGVDQEACREVNPDADCILPCKKDFDKVFP